MTLCSDATGCGADEICLKPRATDATGICTKTCAGLADGISCRSSERKQHGLAETCVEGSTSQSSGTGTGSTTRYVACAFLCRAESTTYGCPKGTSCWSIDASYAICVPPQ